MAFIGLDRGIVDHWIYQDAEYFKVWFEMLYRARYSTESSIELIEGQLTEIKYGEFIFGRIKWSERIGISERRLRTLMDKLIADNMIYLVKRAPKFSIYCVSNYAKYRPQNDQQEALEPQGFEGYSDQQNVQQTTSKRPANVQQVTTKEQRNKDNKVNKDKENKIAYAENVQLTESEYQRLVEEYGKELTDRSVEYLSSYKVEKSYKTKSDNLTIRRWVIDAAKKVTAIQPAKKVGENNVEYGGRNKAIKTAGNTSTWAGTEQRESKVYKGRWDDSDVSLPVVQG